VRSSRQRTLVTRLGGLDPWHRWLLFDPRGARHGAESCGRYVLESGLVEIRGVSLSPHIQYGRENRCGSALHRPGLRRVFRYAYRAAPLVPDRYARRYPCAKHAIGVASSRSRPFSQSDSSGSLTVVGDLIGYQTGRSYKAVVRSVSLAQPQQKPPRTNTAARRRQRGNADFKTAATAARAGEMNAGAHSRAADSRGGIRACSTSYSVRIRTSRKVYAPPTDTQTTPHGTATGPTTTTNRAHDATPTTTSYRADDAAGDDRRKIPDSIDSRR